MSAIRQVWCRFAHSLAEDRQVFVELSIIEGAKCDVHTFLVTCHQTWQLEERAESSPRRMGIGVWKIVVTRPHDEIGQRKLTHRHDVIFAVIEFIHGPLSCYQVLQCAQEITLLLRIAVILLTFLATLGIGSPHLLPAFLQVRIDQSLLLFNLGTSLLVAYSLFPQRILMGVELTILLVSILLRLLPAPVVELTSLAGTGFGSCCPQLRIVQLLLQGGSLLGHLGIDDGSLAIAMIRVQAKRQKKIADDVLLHRPASNVGLCQLYGIHAWCGGDNGNQLGRGGGSRRGLSYPA